MTIETKLFQTILHNHFTLASDSEIEAGVVKDIVLPLLGVNMHAYKRFCVFLEEDHGVIRNTSNHKRGRFFTGMRQMITRDSLQIDREAFSKNGRFFITTAHAASQVHPGFMATIKNWLNRNDAELVVLPGCAHVKALEKQPTSYDPTVLLYANKFATSYTINDNLVAMDLKILPQQRDPLGGLTEWGKGEQSVIVASPRQRFETIPISNTKLPRSMMSTGACTLPHYQKNRIGGMAARDHVIGGIVVEAANGLFHSRHVQAYEDGSFIDLANVDSRNPGAIKYLPNGEIEYVRPEALVCGDVHGDLLDPAAWRATQELIRLTRPKVFIINEICDGNTFNPHEKGRALDLAVQRFPSMEYEFTATRAVFDVIVDYCTAHDCKVIVLESNHDRFFERHLTSMDWRLDATNLSFCAKMFVRQLEHDDALQNYIDPDNRAEWVGDRQDLFIGGFFIAHGDIGTGGSKGSLKQISKITRSVTHHSHKPGILNGSVQGGCLCALDQKYNKGFKGWLHSNTLIYPESHFSHVVIIDGEWRG